MNHQIKRFLLKFYPLISISMFIGAILSFIFGPLTWQALAVIEGGVVSFALSVQKQQVEEVRLFKALFETFNERYDVLNEELNRIYREPFDGPFMNQETDTLFNYFNLCAEEYFYFREGFIHPHVWQAWNNGMKFFRRNHRIRKFWDEELVNNSYYGMRFEPHDEKICKF